jgi:hypothetical protein
MRYVFRAPAEPPGGRAVLMEAELIRECRIGPTRAAPRCAPLPLNSQSITEESTS